MRFQDAMVVRERVERSSIAVVGAVAVRSTRKGEFLRNQQGMREPLAPRTVSKVSHQEVLGFVQRRHFARAERAIEAISSFDRSLQKCCPASKNREDDDVLAFVVQEEEEVPDSNAARTERALDQVEHIPRRRQVQARDRRRQ